MVDTVQHVLYEGRVKTRQPSVAARALHKALFPSMTQREFARRLGVSNQAVQNWLGGKAVPEPQNMAAIEELLGIPMRAWVEEPSEEDAEGTACPDESGPHTAISPEDVDGSPVPPAAASGPALAKAKASRAKKVG